MESWQIILTVVVLVVFVTIILLIYCINYKINRYTDLFHNTGGIDKSKLVKNVARKMLTDTLYLKDIKCLCCGRELPKYNKYCLCDDCYKVLPFIDGTVCQKCGEPIKSSAKFCVRCKSSNSKVKNLKYFDKARAMFYYNGFIKKAIIDYKYHGHKYYAEYFGRLLYDFYKNQNFDFDVIIPAPMTEKGLKKRNFNQVELLLDEFSKNGYEINTDCVKKICETQNQVNLDFSERQTNLIGAFKVFQKDAVKDKNILLVDDVYTTGATTNEISKVLRKAGAKSIFVLTLCHELPENQTN